MIPGFYYVKNYLSKKELKDIKQHLSKSNKWQGVGKSPTSRKVIHYGYNYSYNRTGITKAEDIPEMFSNLVTKDRINKAIGQEVLKEDMEQLIINEYKPGQGIAFHIDHTSYFGPVIVCITVGSGIEIDFVDGQDPSKKITYYVEEGSLYVMSDQARYRWKHGIQQRTMDGDKQRGTRHSLTYRTIKND